MFSKGNSDAIFLSVPGVTGIADDMIIYGKTNHEHDGKSPEHFGSMQKEQFDIKSR